MWLLTGNAIVELPHNALCIYNAPLREFADLIGTLLRRTSCLAFSPPLPHAVARLHPAAGANARFEVAAAEQVVVAGMRLVNVFF